MTMRQTFSVKQSYQDRQSLRESEIGKEKRCFPQNMKSSWEWVSLRLTEKDKTVDGCFAQRKKKD